MSISILAIDIGNTRSKIAIFQQKELLKVKRVATKYLEKSLEECLGEYESSRQFYIGWTNVASNIAIEDFEIWQAQATRFSFHHIKNSLDLPIQNAYKTPETLGIDRIVAVLGARTIFPKNPILVFDAGTALTYDFVTQDGIYMGGGISPGIHMRFKALHTFTAKLPLIEEIRETALIGRSTYESMCSGVLNGILAEVEGIFMRYKAKYGADLKLCITGGDGSFFENHLKSVNFADENLTLIGIHYIITHKFKV